MIRTTLSTTHMARSARCLLMAAALTLTTALSGGMLQGQVAAYANASRHSPLMRHWGRPKVHGLTFSHQPTPEVHGL
jgi:hypothetical protein